MASAYAGRPMGPGALDLTGAASAAIDRVDFAEALVREGCVGETLAAIEATHRAIACTQSEAQAALHQIADDEARHAQLAWRTLAWLLETDHDGQIRARVNQVLAEEGARVLSMTTVGHASDEALAHGLLDDGAVAAALISAWHAVVAPSWADLDGPSAVAEA
jgi:hypothetical protein